MKIPEVMSTPMVTVGPDASFHEVVTKLLDNDISGVPAGPGRVPLLPSPLPPH